MLGLLKGFGSPLLLLLNTARPQMLASSRPLLSCTAVTRYHIRYYTTHTRYSNFRPAFNHSYTWRPPHTLVPQDSLRRHVSNPVQFQSVRTSWRPPDHYLSLSERPQLGCEHVSSTILT